MSDPVVVDQLAVEQLDLVGRDPMAFVLAQAGGHPVYRRAVAEHLLDPGSTLRHPLDDAGRERDRLAGAGHRDQFGRGQG